MAHVHSITAVSGLRAVTALSIALIAAVPSVASAKGVSTEHIRLTQHDQANQRSRVTGTLGRGTARWYPKGVDGTRASGYIRLYLRRGTITLEPSVATVAPARVAVVGGTRAFKGVSGGGTIVPGSKVTRIGLRLRR